MNTEKATILRIVKNVHFWVIFTLLTIIAIIYYVGILHINDSFRWYYSILLFEFSYHVNGILALLPLVYATIVFRWWGALITWIISLVILLPHIMLFARPPESFVWNIAFFLLPLSIVAIITLQLNWRKKERKALEEREAERQSYMSQIFRGQEEERLRIARELHDGATQTLMVLAHKAKAIYSSEDQINMLKVKEEIKWLGDTALLLSEEIRRISLDLSPSVLDDMGLLPAIRWIIDQCNRDGTLDVNLNVDGKLPKQSYEKEVFVFRIVQESLNNIIKHSSADKAVVNIKSRYDECQIIIRDNGKGFDLPRVMNQLAAQGKLGIVGMKQRVAFLGGDFFINSELGKGTTIEIKIKTGNINHLAVCSNQDII